MKNVEALKALYEALGGSAADVANASTSVDVLNAIAAKYEGAADADLNPEAIANIAAVAGNIGGGGGGDYPIWHVTINSVAVPTYGLSFNASVWEDENHNQYYKNFVESDGKWFYSYGLGLDNGLSNKDLAFVILDDTASANLYMNEVNGYTVSVTGDVEFVNDEGWNFYATGDGTITITAA